jgi:hypothetical protein
MRHLAIIVAVMLCFTACWGIDDPDIIVIRSLSDAEKKFSNLRNRPSPDDRVHLRVFINLGDLSQPDNNYLRLLEIVENYNLYAYLDLASTTMDGTLFTVPPLDEAVKGMDRITGISFPAIITSIMADNNGKSPFFFYENLSRVSRTSWQAAPVKIGDSIFSFLKKLKTVSIGLLKTVGNEAFRGCENLNWISLSSVETIENYAFYDCSALERLSMPIEPPLLGNSVFLGSTPNNLILEILKSSEELYCAWLVENASKFNNNGFFVQNLRPFYVFHLLIFHSINIFAILYNQNCYFLYWL